MKAILNEHCEEFFNTLLELEGLVLLKMTRDDSAPAEVDTLIASKLKRLESLTGNAPDEAPATPAIDDTEAEAVASTVEFEEQSDACTDCPEPAHRFAVEPMEDLPVTFTLNDRFRFRRELFGGSDEALDSAMRTLSKGTDEADCERIAREELHLDTDRSEVRELIAIAASSKQK